MRYKTKSIKVWDYIPVTGSYICNICAIYLLVHQYNVIDKIQSASIEMQIMYWGVNGVFGIMYLISLLLMIKTHPLVLSTR